MSIRNICFYGEIEKIIENHFQYSSITDPLMHSLHRCWKTGLDMLCFAHMLLEIILLPLSSFVDSSNGQIYLWTHFTFNTLICCLSQLIFLFQIFPVFYEEREIKMADSPNRSNVGSPVASLGSGKKSST